MSIKTMSRTTGIMMRFATTTISMVLPALALSAGAWSQSAPAKPHDVQSVLVHAGKVLDVRTGNYLPDRGILIENGRIREVGPFAQVKSRAPAGAQNIDLSQATVLPGIIDCHTHLMMVEQASQITDMSTAERALLGAAIAREAIEAGITTVRDLGNSGVNGDVALRNAIQAKWVVGPRIIASTRALSPVGGQFDSMRSEAGKAVVALEYAGVSGPLEARRAVDEAAFAGADVIKVIVDTGQRENYTVVLDADTIRAIVDEAHRSRLKVAAHATSNQAIKAAATAGVDSIEHAYFINDDNLRLMLEKHIYLVPTDSDKPPAFYIDRLQRAMKMGVKIAFGSDARGPGSGRNADKTFSQRSLGTLVAYQQAGLSPLEIIRAATINAADLLGWSDAAQPLMPAEKKFVVDDNKVWQDRLGAIEPERFADLIAVRGDPLKDLSELQRVIFVMKEGSVIKDATATAGSH
jgi:imidazolonepropionase-like amidohydrolase